MKKAIAWGVSLFDAELKYKEWCRTNNIPCRFKEAIFLSSKMSLSWNQEKIRGYWREVMEDRIKLINMSKEMFVSIYNSF